MGPLNAAGFPGYSNTSLTPSTWLPTDNVKLTITTATTASMTANTTINTLNVSLLGQSDDRSGRQYPDPGRGA